VDLDVVRPLAPRLVIGEPPRAVPGTCSERAPGRARHAVRTLCVGGVTLRGPASLAVGHVGPGLFGSVGRARGFDAVAVLN
jgi:hypothetical protein